MNRYSIEFFSREPGVHREDLWTVCERIPKNKEAWPYCEAVYCKHHLAKIICHRSCWRNSQCKREISRDAYLQYKRKNCLKASSVLNDFEEIPNLRGGGAHQTLWNTSTCENSEEPSPDKMSELAFLDEMVPDPYIETEKVVKFIKKKMKRYNLYKWRGNLFIIESKFENESDLSQSNFETKSLRASNDEFSKEPKNNKNNLENSPSSQVGYNCESESTKSSDNDDAAKKKEAADHASKELFKVSQFDEAEAKNLNGVFDACITPNECENKSITKASSQADKMLIYFILITITVVLVYCYSTTNENYYGIRNSDEQSTISYVKEYVLKTFEICLSEYEKFTPALD